MDQLQTYAPTDIDDSIDLHLLFGVDQSLYGVSSALVLEIIDIHQHITHLPRVAAYIKGIIHLRGTVVPVIDVRCKLHLEERPYDDKTCIVILEVHDMQIGLIVDYVSEVITIDNEQLATPPSVGEPAARYLSSVWQTGDRVVLNIDVDRFFASDLELLRV